MALKVWRPDGVIVYSPDRTLIGERFPVEGGLASALGGTIVAAMSSLEASENVSERSRFDRLLEMYLPVRERGSERIIAVAEFYQLPTEIDQEVGQAQLQSWLAVGGAVALVYLLLFGIVRQGSDTIVRAAVSLRDRSRAVHAPRPERAAAHACPRRCGAHHHPERAEHAPDQQRPARRTRTDAGAGHAPPRASPHAPLRPMTRSSTTSGRR